MTRDYLKFMTSDLLMQFRGEDCVNTKILLSAFAKQLDDLLEAFRQLDDRTFLRLLDKDETGELLKYGAHNKQLDRIGEVVDLTRKQATLVSNKIANVSDIERTGKITDDTLLNFIKDNFSTYYPDDVLGDPEYSEYLYYKIFLNSSYCTYKDVIKSLASFWTETPIYYSEPEDSPATMILSVPELTPEQNARLFFLAPVVKSAGVGLFRKAVTKNDTIVKAAFVGGCYFNEIIQCELPYLEIDFSFSNSLGVHSRFENIVHSEIKENDDIFLSYYSSNRYTLEIKEEALEKYSSIVVPAIHQGKVVTQMYRSRNYDNSSVNSVVEEVYLPDTVVNLGDVFRRFKALKYVKLPSALTFVSSGAFYGCSSLKTVVFPLSSKVKNIGSEAFRGCSSLEEVVVPASLERLEVRAFYGCTNLKRVVFGGTQEQWENIPRTSGNNAFFNAEIEILGGI